MPQRLNRRFLAFAAMAVAIIGLGIFALEPKRPGVLATHPRELRLEMKFGAKEDIFVRLENVGGFPVVISSVNSSCGCTVGIPEAKELGPGKSTRLKVEVRATSLGRKDAIVDVNYDSPKERKVARIPIVITTTEAPGTRVLSFPKDLVTQCAPSKECREVFEVQTSEKFADPPDLAEVTSDDNRCRFRVLDVKNAEPDQHGKNERTYRIEITVAPSEPFAAIAKLQFRGPLAMPVGNLAIFARHQARTRLVPSTVDLRATLTESSRHKHEVLLISEVDIEDWRVADQATFPAWLSIDVEKLRSNLTRVTIADSRTPERKPEDVPDFQLTLSSSVETVFLPVRIRD